MNVGAAEIDITPDFPVELSGFALRPQPSTGVADPIFAPLDLAIDRRGKPTAHVDRQVSALAWKRRDRPGYAAACINHAMHPVSYGREFRQISADWCRSASLGISRALSGIPVTLVSNGAAGNINPPLMDQPPEVAAAYGQRICDAVLPALRDAQPRAIERFSVRATTVPLP